LENLLESGLLTALSFTHSARDGLFLVRRFGLPRPTEIVGAPTQRTARKRTFRIMGGRAWDMIKFRKQFPPFRSDNRKNGNLYSATIPTSTLVRTTSCRKSQPVSGLDRTTLTRWDGARCFFAAGKGRWSPLWDASRQRPFFDREGRTKALFGTIEKATLIKKEIGRVERLPFHIKDPDSVAALADNDCQLRID